ncbi:MAG: hypothetical protein JSW53_06295 [Candidatus Bathyarchaeota archaeon]|nr:MAG: hypothetical protein JSW53_06295 [Candidatus Bathyarchaeota archaeon]
MTLLRCRKQGLVGARARKRGRVRENIYRVTERGTKRLEYYFATGAEVDCGRVNLDAVVRSAENDVQQLMLLGSWSFNNANSICSNTWKSDVFSDAKQIAWLSTVLLMSRPELIIASAAKEMLAQISPSTLKRITDLTNESPRSELHTMAMIGAELNLERICRSKPPIIENLVNLTIMKMQDLNLGLYILYRMWEEEKGEKEVYRCLYNACAGVARTEKSEVENTHLAVPYPAP